MRKGCRQRIPLTLTWCGKLKHIALAAEARLRGKKRCSVSLGMSDADRRPVRSGVYRDMAPSLE